MSGCLARSGQILFRMKFTSSFESTWFESVTVLIEERDLSEQSTALPLPAYLSRRIAESYYDARVQVLGNLKIFSKILLS